MVKIIDLDNTISDDEWRLKYIKDTDDMFIKYDWYHRLSSWDLPYHKAIFKPNRDVPLYIFTSRPTAYCEQTARWLLRWGITYDAMLMRPDDNFESSPVLKARFLDRLFAMEYRTDPRDFTAYDDREDVIEMYKRKGINAVLKQINKRR